MNDEYYDPEPTGRALMTEANEEEDDNLNMTTPRRNRLRMVDDTISANDGEPGDMFTTKNNIT